MRVLERAWHSVELALLDWFDLFEIGSLQTRLREHLIRNRYVLKLSRCSGGRVLMRMGLCAGVEKERGELGRPDCAGEEGGGRTRTASRL